MSRSGAQNAVELAYAEITSSQTGIAAAVDVAGLAITFATTTRPAMVHAFFPLIQQVASAGVPALFITDAANNELSRGGLFSLAAGGGAGGLAVECRVPAGTASATYKVRASTSAGTLTIATSNTGASTYKPFIRAYQV